MCYERTDMAIEASALFNKSKDDIEKVRGIVVTEENKDDIIITKIKVLNEEGAKSVGKPIGEYITLDMNRFSDTGDEFKENLSGILSSEINSLLSQYSDETLFVVGLGNKNITPDALGPKVADGIYVTRHLFDELPEYVDENTKSVCAVSPGVLGVTGIETLEVIKGIVHRIKPSVVICIDALATRRIDRLFSSLQLTNTGITPGAGVGNRRNTINCDTIGVPVIAIGVPTVVDGATIANDSIKLLIQAVENYSSQNQKGYIEKIDDEKRYSLVREILKPYGSQLVVTPKDVDCMIDEMASVISNAINTSMGNV